MTVSKHSTVPFKTLFESQDDHASDLNGSSVFNEPLCKSKEIFNNCQRFLKIHLHTFCWICNLNRSRLIFMNEISSFPLYNVIFWKPVEF